MEDVCRISATTISGNNAFFAEANLLAKEGNGYKPTEPTLDFGRAEEFNAPDAVQKLKPALVETWFWQALLPRLEFGPISKDEAILKLAEAARAEQEHRGQLETVLEWLDACGLIHMEGEQISKMAFRVESSQPKESLPVESVEDQMATPRSMPAPEASRSNAMTFSVSVNVDMNDLLGWEPERIAAFFEGVAKVIAAQNGGTPSEV